MPHRLIGRTAGFGPVSRGSSPRGATRKKVQAKAWTFFYAQPPQARLQGGAGHKKSKADKVGSFFLGISANA